MAWPGRLQVPEAAALCACHEQSLLATESAAVELAELQKLVLKIFWSATYLSVPPLLTQPAQFQGWLECLLEAVRRPVPQVPLP